MIVIPCTILAIMPIVDSWICSSICCFSLTKFDVLFILYVLIPTKIIDIQHMIYAKHIYHKIFTRNKKYVILYWYPLLSKMFKLWLVNPTALITFFLVDHFSWNVLPWVWNDFRINSWFYIILNTLQDAKQISDLTNEGLIQWRYWNLGVCW